MVHEALKIGSRITVLPVIHGSGDFAIEVRRVMLSESFDCVAVPLPASYQPDVENAIRHLPTPALVSQSDVADYQTQWSTGDDYFDADSRGDGEPRTLSYVPIDPCQAVIAALRIAMGEHISREFIDLETRRFEPTSALLPDPYALKKVAIERFAAAILPTLGRLPAGQPNDRVIHMANRLRDLEHRYRSILMVCSVLDWPWIREAYSDRVDCLAEHEDVEDTSVYQVDPRTLIFLTGELPYITALYEQARADLDDDENLSIDGVKDLLVAARAAYLDDFRGRARKITPHLLSSCLKYIRNLSLIERRISPDLYNIVMAAKQVFGDQYAIHVAETARQYRYSSDTPYETIKLGINQAQLPDGEIVRMVNRLPGPPVTWRSCDLRKRPDKQESERWKMQWNPFSQCSWPPEDELIESFRTHVFDRAKAVLGADLARSEKFTTSVMDGIDIRETLRHWYDDDIYVKILPPARGDLDSAVMLFDSPADPRDYPWRATWYAEHENESTLAFFATDFRKEMVGPGICLATYGGALFLYPPVAVPDIWTDPRLDFTDTLEQRLLAAACLHSQSPHVALLSHAPPGAGYRKLARRFHRKWVHIPLGGFSDSTIQQLRIVHVLNGKQVRSYAADFIRRA